MDFCILNPELEMICAQFHKIHQSEKQSFLNLI